MYVEHRRSIYELTTYINEFTAIDEQRYQHRPRFEDDVAYGLGDGDDHFDEF